MQTRLLTKHLIYLGLVLCQTTMPWVCMAQNHTAGVAPTPASSHPQDIPVSADTLSVAVQKDWIKQAEAWRSARNPLTTQSDAAGAVDGVKNGLYAFHTGQEANPWWQVDLREIKFIQTIRVFNRLDYEPGLHNADSLRILTSDDGKNWSLRHDNKGRHFGGVRGGGPLVVDFMTTPVQARYVRLMLPSNKPIFFHLDEVEVYGPDNPNINLALHCPADQSSLSQWSTIKRHPSDTQDLAFPVPETLERGRRLAMDLQKAGVNTLREQVTLTELTREWKSLGTKPDVASSSNLYLRTKALVRKLAFSNPLLDFNRLLFVKRHTQESYPDVCLNHMPWVSRPGGDLCVLSSAESGQLFRTLAGPDPTRKTDGLQMRNILNGALGPGHVHGMDLWWAGDRVVFGYAKAKKAQPPEGWLDRMKSYHLRRTEEPTHIFEVRTDGQKLRQLTSGEWSDLDPTYAPNGDIVFVSERCGTSLQCNEYDKDETSCNLYVMRPDGTGIRGMSVNKDGDYLPHTLDDGTIAYTRWEYHERSWAYIQSIWIVRPDGTGADAIFKQHFVNPWALEDTRSIPASKKLVSIATGHHTLAVGPLVIVDPSAGINEPKGITIVTPGVKPPEGGMDGVPVESGGVLDGGGFYSTPWALSEKYFLVSYNYGKETDPAGYGLYLVDVFGNRELVYRDPEISCFMPMPHRARPRPPVLGEIPPSTQGLASCLISDVSFGSEEIASRIRYIRIAEPIGWPYDNLLGGQRYGEKGPQLINWTPIRILGDVAVERDGSAHFQVPPDTAVYFQLLDENRMELRRMRSFISFQPGEVRACAGCHESRGVVPPAKSPSIAASRPPQPLIPPPWGDRPVSFLRDIQPILDRHCAECHSGFKPAGGLDFFAGLTDWSRSVENIWGLVPGYGFNRAFETIVRSNLVAVAEPNLQDASITPSFAYGAHRSKLMNALNQKPHLSRITLNSRERLALSMWMDANAPYHDRFVNKRSESKSYDLATDRELEKQLASLQERRCGTCHKTKEVSRLDWIHPTHADQSLFLRAPLARKQGGTEKCAKATYESTTDPDYQAVLRLVENALKQAHQRPRRDLLSIAK